jgi:hypothetical protein
LLSQEDLSSQVKDPQENQNISELSNLPPIDVGRSLAISIGNSCNIDNISEEEILLISKCNSSLERYDKERLVLGAFAQDYAIVSVLGDSEIGKQVREGFLEVWKNIAKHDEKNNALFRLFVNRCSVYVDIADKVLQPEAISPLGVEFAKCLGIDYSNGSAIILAEKYVAPVFWGHYEGAIKIFEQAGLLEGN